MLIGMNIYLHMIYILGKMLCTNESFENKNNQVQYYSIILDQRGTLSPQLNLICEVLSDLFNNILVISCLKWTDPKWLSNKG